jgi:hypothetical protein
MRRLYVGLEGFKFSEGFDERSNNRIYYEPMGVCKLITPGNWA